MLDLLFKVRCECNKLAIWRFPSANTTATELSPCKAHACIWHVHYDGTNKLGLYRYNITLAIVKGDVHPAIVTLGRKYSSGEVTGATARAVAMLMAFKHVVMDYNTPTDKVRRGAGTHLTSFTSSRT